MAKGYTCTPDSLHRLAGISELHHSHLNLLTSSLDFFCQLATLEMLAQREVANHYSNTKK